MVPRFLTEVIVMPFMPLKRNRRVFLSLVREINESNKFSLSKIFTSYPTTQFVESSRDCAELVVLRRFIE